MLADLKSCCFVVVDAVAMLRCLGVELVVAAAAAAATVEIFVAVISYRFDSLLSIEIIYAFRMFIFSVRFTQIH